MMFSLSQFAPEKLVSWDGFALRLNLLVVLTHGIPGTFHEGVHIYTVNRYWVSSKFTGSRYCMPMAFTAKSPLAQCL